MSREENMFAGGQQEKAEQMFLSGMYSYQRGWYEEGFDKVRQAGIMEPNNQRYKQALDQMQHPGADYRNTAQDKGYMAMDQGASNQAGKKKDDGGCSCGDCGCGDCCDGKCDCCHCDACDCGCDC